MPIYRIEAEGDVMFAAADNKTDAREILYETTGFIPEHLLVFEEVDEVPEGETCLE